jgi:glycosyltransferase involved in cell wall biosynthesis
MAIDVSIVVPTYNRRSALKELLESLLYQSYPKDKFEVILVDDDSDIKLEDLVCLYKAKGLDITYTKQKRGGPAKARNKGVKVACGSIICFTDDDCVASRDWVERLALAHRENPDVDVIGGNTWIKEGDIRSAISQFLANGCIFWERGTKKEIIFFPTCNVSIKRDVFKEELFNEDIPYPGGEDLEYFWRLYKKGYNFAYEGKAFILHNRRNSLAQFLFQPFIYGKGNSHVRRYQPDHPALKELTTPLYTLKSLLFIPLFALHIANELSKLNKAYKRYKPSIVFYVCLYRIMYFLGYFWENIKFALRWERK